jgi:hypothetical protein
MNNKYVSRTHIMGLTVLFSLIAAVGMNGCGSDAPKSGGAGAAGQLRNPLGLGPAPVSLSPSGGTAAPGDLQAAGNYVILAKTGINNATGSMLTGDIAISPVAASYFTGFNPAIDASGTFATSTSVVGKMYAADYSEPTPTNLTVAIGNMGTAYTDGAGRTNPDFTELYTGLLGGQTLTPGLYKWGNSVNIATTMYLSGSATDVWIFQIAGDVSMAASQSIIMQGGALPQNVFWVVAGEVTIMTSAHFEGIILSQTAVTLQSGASMNGRIFAQSLVTLDNNAVTQP